MKRNEATFCRYKAHNYYYDKLCVVQYLFMGWRSIVCIFALDFHRNKDFLIISVVWECLLLGCLWPPEMGKIVDGSSRRRCVFKSPFSGADFCWEGTSHFSLSCEQIRKSTWNKHKIIAWSYWPLIYTNDYLNTVFDDLISLCGNRSNNAFPLSPRERLSRVKSLTLQERNMLFVDRLVK